MASSSEASACLVPSREKDNFLRLSTLLVDGGTKLLRQVFSHINAPTTLDEVLTKSATKDNLKKSLPKSEYERIFLPGGGFSALEDLDITLLFKLLRYTCNLTPPATGNWNSLPNPAHIGHGDDLARIKFYRNEVYAHVTDMTLVDEEFARLWGEVKSAMVRLAKNMRRAKEWEDLIGEYRSGPLTSKEKDYVEELKHWYEQDRDLRAQVEELRAEIPREVQRVVAESLQQVVQEIKGSYLEHGGRTTYERQLLTERLEDFKHDVRPTLLLGYVSCLTDDDKEHIRADERDRSIEEANKTLVESLKRQQQGLHQFVGALRKSGNGHVALLLDPKGKIDTGETDDESEPLEADEDLLIIVGTAIDARFCGGFCNKVKNEEISADLEAEIVDKYADPSSSETVELRKKLDKILPPGVAFVRTEKGSVACILRISSLSGAEKLFELYENKALVTKLQESLLDCTFKSEFRKEELVYEVNFSPERRELIYQKLKAFEREEEDNTGPPKSKNKGVAYKKMNVEGSDPEAIPKFSIPKVFLGNEAELGSLELKLREYQKELADTALQGKNSIICAPTNSGKTYVAVHIAKEHLGGSREGEGAAASEGQSPKKRKVVFIVNTVNLVAQQKERFQIFLGSQYSVSDMSGAKANEIPLKYLLQENDIVVMTAQILVNALKDKDNQVALSDISLLIFDECHHAQKEHPYNKVMEQYLALKLQPGIQHELPQVVGLTASLGVGNTDIISKAVEHILQICGNLDAQSVSTVRVNKEELSRYANTPDRKVFMVSGRGHDVFVDVISRVMDGIETNLGQVIPPPPRDRCSQAYRQWLEELYKRAILDGDRYLVTYVEQLRVYHVALDINSTLRMKDAMKSLEKYFAALDEEKFTAVDRKLKQQYDQAKETLEDYILKYGEPENANLKQLQNLIAGAGTSGASEASEEAAQTNSKGIVFTATRESTKALLEWIEENERLNTILKPATIVGGGDSESGMTRFEQENAIKRFKDGEVNILLATNVAEEGLDISDCDYVIRYNVMGNEISSVQSRGRVRAKEGGKFLIVAKQESAVFKRETLNKYRELLMADAVDRVQKMDLEEFSQKVKILQKKVLDDRYFKKKARETRQLEFQPGDVTFYCKKCKVPACQARHLRSIRETYRVIHPDILQDKVSVKPHPKRGKLIDGVDFISKVHCGKCNEDWGVKVLIDNREWISLKVRSFLLEYSDGSKTMHKQWKDVRFKVAELEEGEDDEEALSTA